MINTETDKEPDRQTDRHAGRQDTDKEPDEDCGLMNKKTNAEGGNLAIATVFASRHMLPRRTLLPVAAVLL